MLLDQDQLLKKNYNGHIKLLFYSYLLYFIFFHTGISGGKLRDLFKDASIIHFNILFVRPFYSLILQSLNHL